VSKREERKKGGSKAKITFVGFYFFNKIRLVSVFEIRILT